MQISDECGCKTCTIKCDLYLTSLEMGLEQECNPVHVQFRKHEVVCIQNGLITHAMAITQGAAKMHIDGINKRSIILNILLPSNLIGLIAVYGTTHYPYNVTALSNCNVCQVEIGFVRKIYTNNQSFQNSLNHWLGHSVTAIMEKMISLNQKQVRGKVAESLLHLSDLFDSERFTLPITRKELGEMSAITEENTVRVLTEFKSEGIINIQGREIILNDKTLLKKISAIG